jgi:hypothetical protein
MTSFPIQSGPVQRSRTFRSASNTSAEGINPSIVSVFGIPFADDSVDPSIIIIPPLIFADDSVDPSIIIIPPLIFADDAE